LRDRFHIDAIGFLGPLRQLLVGDQQRVRFLCVADSPSIRTAELTPKSFASKASSSTRISRAEVIEQKPGFFSGLDA
jgi:hypothetical protein